METSKVNKTIENWEFFAKKGDEVFIPTSRLYLHPLVYDNKHLVIEEIIKKEVTLYKNSFSPKIDFSFILKNTKNDLLILEIFNPTQILPKDYVELTMSSKKTKHEFVKYLLSNIDRAVDWYYQELIDINSSKRMSKEEIRKYFESCLAEDSKK